MDGGSWPDAVTHFGGGQNAIGGVKICGPAGFLSLLEEKLGLPVRLDNESHRISVWMGLLSQGPTSAFYMRSFKEAPWQTARTVLALRDRLKKAGAFEGDMGARSIRAAAHPRLAEMFRLEAAYARTTSAPGQADRIRSLIAHVADWGISGIREVELLEPIDCWEEPWPGFFSILTELGVNVGHGTRGQAPLPMPPEFYRLDAENPSEAAQALAAALVSRQSGELGRVVFIRREDSFELDAALQSFGLAGTGCRLRSTARPALQLLPLFLRLHLFPFDPEILRQFLLLPLSPLDGDFAMEVMSALRFAEVLPDRRTGWPEAWPSAWRGLLDTEGKTHGRFISTAERRRFLEWITPENAILPEEAEHGLSARAFALADALERWASSESRHIPELESTSALCRKLKEALHGSPSLNQMGLEQLLESLIGEGEKPSETRMSLPWTVLTSTGQLFGSADTVIWWDCVDDGSAPRDDAAWSFEERRWLEGEGIQPDSVSAVRRSMEAAMRRPFQYARRLILITPRMIGGEESSAHPVMALLPESSQPHVVKATDVLQGKAADAFWQVGLDALPPAVPALEWDSFTERQLKMPIQLSPSSLNKLLECPARWYFENILELDASIVSLQSEATQKGNIAHDAVEGLLAEDKEAGGLQEEEFKQAALARRLYCAAQNRAARLAAPEKQAILQDMAARLEESLDLFKRDMRQNGLVFLDAEKTCRGELDGIPYKGRYDVALADAERPEEASVIVDLKWSKSGSFAEQMKKGSIQLASYWYLLKHGTVQGRSGTDIREVRYFLMPKAEIISSADPRNPALEDQWDAVYQDWTLLKEKLESGLLPTALDWAMELERATHPDETEDKVEKAASKRACAACQYCSCGLLCGSRVSKKKEGR